MIRAAGARASAGDLHADPEQAGRQQHGGGQGQDLIARKAGIPSTCDPLEVEFAEVHIAEQLHKASPRVRAAAWVLRALPPILIVVALAAKEWLAGRLDEPISWALLLYSALLAAYWPILLWQTRPKPKRRPNAPRPSRVRDPVFEAWLAEQAAARAR